jgi:hypothetical protein
MSSNKTLLGNVDVRSPTVVGWAVDFENPDEPCALDLFINGAFALTTRTGNVGRPDVVASYPELKRDHFGFRLDIRQWLKPIDQTVEIRFNRGGGLLSGGSFLCKVIPSGIELLEGPNGYLFYKGDSNDALVQLSRPCAQTQSAIDAACMALAATHTVCSNFGAVYGAMIMPDRAAAVPDEVGNSFELSPKRPAPRLIEHARNQYGLDLLYPIEQICGLPTERRALKFDTHLTGYATYRAFLALAARYFPERIEKHEEWIKWEETKYQGDLVFIGGLDASEIYLAPRFNVAPIEVFDTLHIYPSKHLTGSTRAYVNEAIDSGVALVFGTSSSKIMIPFFSTFFRVVGHVWNNAVDYDLISKLRPTHVFHVVTEKTLGNLVIPNVLSAGGERILAVKEAYAPEAHFQAEHT